MTRKITFQYLISRKSGFFVKSIPCLLMLSCGFNFSLPGKKATLIPDHPVKPTGIDTITSRQDSYVHTNKSLILTKQKILSTGTENDQKFWEDYLLPFRLNKKPVDQLLAELGGQQASADHTISAYRCRLSTQGAKNQAIPGALISYPVSDPCLTQNTEYFAIFRVNPVTDTEMSYFLSILAESLEDSLRRDVSAINQTMKSFSFEAFNSLKILNSIVVFGKINKTMVVYFHGSLTSDDWQNNLTFKLENADWFSQNSGMVHGGFNQTIQKIWPEMNRILVKNSDISQTFFVGFSRGGALATLAGLKWAIYGKASYVYTFGQPRVGNKKFIQFIDEIKNLNILRLLNQDDIIGRLPPENNSLPYFDFIFTL